MTTITVLSKPDCHFCDDAKATLAGLARKFGLDVEAVELSSERGRQLAIGSGMLFPPGILIDSVPFSYGRLSERRLRRCAGSRAAVALRKPRPPAAGPCHDPDTNHHSGGSRHDEIALGWAAVAVTGGFGLLGRTLRTQ